MAHLKTDLHFGEPGERYRYAYAPADACYAMLIEGHRELTDAQSELFNARLVLLLANQVGDLRVLREAIDAARRGVVGPEAQS